MKENLEKIDGEIVTNEEANATILHFAEPDKYEGKEYNEIDLSGLKDITAMDMIEAQRYMSDKGSFTVLPEMTLEYACFMAARKTGKDIGFFLGLSAKNAIKLKNKVDF